MRRIYDFGKRAIQRVNARIAILIVAVLVGTVLLWQGYKYLGSKKKVDGPTQEIATGPAQPAGGINSPEASLDPTQRLANPSNEQFNGGGGNPNRVAGYDAAGNPQEQLNPYAPSGDDPAGGGNGYSGGYGSPADPTASAGQVPENPYRGGTSSGGSGYGSLNDSPTVAGIEKPSTGGGKPSASSPDAISDPVAAYSQQLGGDATGGTPETESLPADPAAQEPAPLATAPAISLTNDTYGLSGRRPATSKQPALAADAGKLAAATPGERQLEGPQQPAIAIEKFSPAEIQVGKPAVFEMLVRNTGQVPAQNVVVSDHVPAGTQLVDVKPQPQQGTDGSLVWSLGTMQPGDEIAITLQVMPQTEGEIGSTAHVTFAASATSRSICTRPQLAIEHTAPPKVLIGESITVGITVSNPGTGPATGVIIEEDVPEGLSHVAGATLEYEVGTLRPGESKRLELSLKAEKAGLIQNVIHVHGEGGLAGEHTVQIEVVAPQLSVEVDGPKRRFLERQATYTLSVANPGTAPARDVELAAFLPRGMKFVESRFAGAV